MATRKSAAKTTGGAARKSPAKTAAKQGEGKPAAKSPAKANTSPRKRAAAPVAVPVAGQPAAEPMSAEARYRWIAHAAYLRAEKRGFAPGHEIDDWLAAEADYLAAHGLRQG
jgi:hypothetical protein